MNRAIIAQKIAQKSCAIIRVRARRAQNGKMGHSTATGEWVTAS